MRRDRGVCYWCGKPGANELEHVTPLALGGAEWDPANLAVIHKRPCHLKKSRRNNAAARLERRH